MTSLRGFFRRRSLRLRITLAFVASAVLLSTALALATLAVTRSFLEDQRIRSSQRQTVFALLFARELLQTRPDPQELVSKLRIRQPFDAMVTARDEWYSTSLSLTPDAIPLGLRGLVRSERFGYQFTSETGQRMLVYGSPLPPAGMDLYLFFAIEDIDQTLSTLRRVIVVTGLVVVAIVAVVARRVSARILHPLAAVSAATQRVAEGLLEVRVQPASSDELGQLASSFNEMAQALKEMIDRERNFVAAVSHELRTPLAALHATAEAVATYRDRLPADGREALDLLRDDVDALGQLVEELMEVSELDAGRATVRPEQVRVRAVVEAIVGRRKLDARVEGADVEISTDKARLERIVANLLDNAYTHGDGTAVRVSLEQTADGCAVAVTDRGPGIEASDVAKLFDRFYKTDQSRSRGRGGVGLGLAIAMQNAELLGGTIHVRTAPGGGSTFTLRLPKDAPSAEVVV